MDPDALDQYAEAVRMRLIEEELRLRALEKALRSCPYASKDGSKCKALRAAHEASVARDRERVS